MTYVTAPFLCVPVGVTQVAIFLIKQIVSLLQQNLARLMISIITHNTMKLITFPEECSNYQIDTIRLHIFHITSKIIKHTGKIKVQLIYYNVHVTLF